MNVLTLLGSLRDESLNRRLAVAAHAFLPDGVQSQIYPGLEALPFYSEDLDADGVTPAAVQALREAVSGADALIVVTPEYNGSISAVLKNAIDWLSRPRGAAALGGKPVAVVAATAAPRGAQWAREDAVRILTVAGADVVSETAGVPSAYNAFDESGLRDPALAAQVRDVVLALTQRQPATA